MLSGQSTFQMCVGHSVEAVLDRDRWHRDEQGRDKEKRDLKTKKHYNTC